MIKVNMKYHDVFDEHYPYLDKSFKFRFKRFWFLIIFNCIALPIASIRFGLKVEGRKNLKKYKKVLDQGFVSISNHVLFWDYMVLQMALFPRKSQTPTWIVNMSSPIRALYRYSGVVPVPKTNVAKVKFAEAMNTVIKDKKWLHIYVEASMWFNYVPIRPFKKGAFIFAYDNKVPILPIVFTYRKPTGIYAWFKDKEPLVTLRIGELQYPNYNLDRAHAVEEMKDRCRNIMIQMAGIESEEQNQELMKLYSYNTTDEPILY